MRRPGLSKGDLQIEARARPQQSGLHSASTRRNTPRVHSPLRRADKGGRRAAHDNHNTSQHTHKPTPGAVHRLCCGAAMGGTNQDAIPAPALEETLQGRPLSSAHRHECRGVSQQPRAARATSPVGSLRVKPSLYDLRAYEKTRTPYISSCHFPLPCCSPSPLTLPKPPRVWLCYSVSYP